MKTIFNPHNHPPQLQLKNDVVTVSDIMPFEKYEDTRNYQEFLKRFDSHYFMKDDKDFSDREIGIFETEVLELMAKGLNNREIAQELCISYYTVRKHAENIREKTGANNKIIVLSKTNKV